MTRKTLFEAQEIAERADDLLINSNTCAKMLADNPGHIDVKIFAVGLSFAMRLEDKDAIAFLTALQKSIDLRLNAAEKRLADL